jgi:hypothetical protein
MMNRHLRAADNHSIAAAQHERAGKAADALGKKMTEIGGVGEGGGAELKPLQDTYRDKSAIATSGSSSAMFSSSLADQHAAVR